MAKTIGLTPCYCQRWRYRTGCDGKVMAGITGAKTASLWRACVTKPGILPPQAISLSDSHAHSASASRARRRRPRWRSTSPGMQLDQYAITRGNAGRRQNAAGLPAAPKRGNNLAARSAIKRCRYDGSPARPTMRLPADHERDDAARAIVAACASAGVAFVRAGSSARSIFYPSRGHMGAGVPFRRQEPAPTCQTTQRRPAFQILLRRPDRPAASTGPAGSA